MLTTMAFLLRVSRVFVFLSCTLRLTTAAVGEITVSESSYIWAQVGNNTTASRMRRISASNDQGNLLTTWGILLDQFANLIDMSECPTFCNFCRELLVKLFDVLPRLS